MNPEQLPHIPSPPIAPGFYLLEGAKLTLLVAAFLVGWSLTPSYAKDDGSGKYDHIPPNVRAWAKSMVSWQGVPCCEIADGTRTVFEIRDGQYWIPIAEKGIWVAVPPEAVITNRGNPVAEWCNDSPEACGDKPGDAMAWYVITGVPGDVYVRCFVPGGGI